MRVIKVKQGELLVGVNCDQIQTVRSAFEGEEFAALIIFTGQEQSSVQTDTPFDQVLQMWREAQ